MNYVEYNWEKPETHAHGYLIPKVINVLKHLEIPFDAEILDAGCGGGALVNTLYQLGYKNVYGFDASTSGIELAKRTFPHITDRFFNHDVYEPNLPSPVPQKYDVIISMEVIEHLYSPKTYLDNCRLWKSMILVGQKND
jgi:2-polyprenyl-6-hydroxyphenyl methylase/3-demethylubiquinone-9 3-methyltransferase